MHKQVGQILGALAVLVSLLFVAYELKRNNDISIVQSQYELLSLQNDLRAMLADPHVLRVVMTREQEALSEAEKLLFQSSVMAWFDLHELVYLAAEQGVMSDEQLEAWTTGMCTLPEHWLMEFSTSLNQGNFMEPVVRRVEECLDPPGSLPGGKN